MSSPALVSVIITAYNRTDYLAQAIESVKQQSYKALQIMVVDDGSKTDDIEHLCQEIGGLNYLRKTNGGLSSARNFGIGKAKGEFVCFLDDDDLWKPEKVEVQLQAFKAYPRAQLVHSSAEVMNDDGSLTGQRIGASDEKAHKRSGWVFWNALGVWVPKSPTVMIRKSALTPDLRFDETIKVGEDIDFYQRFFYRHEVRYITEPLAYYREYAQSDRLSKQHARYLGIGLKMISNFKAMGVGNKVSLRRIADRLLEMEIRHYRQAYPERESPVPNWKRQLFPFRCLKQYFSGT